MAHSDIYAWMLEQLENYLSSKGRVADALAKIPRDKELLPTITQEIQVAIDRYNQLIANATKLETTHAYLSNANHLHTLWRATLPDYFEVILALQHNDKLSMQVMSELRDSAYFSEIYEITDNTHLVINLFLLLYRTTLLHLYPNLRNGKAQISSTIEEMAGLLYLEGNTTGLFEATKLWIRKWREEGFSPDLAKLIVN